MNSISAATPSQQSANSQRAYLRDGKIAVTPNSEIWVGHNPSTGSPVAIKKISDESNASREVTWLRDLAQCPHLVRYRDCFTEGVCDSENHITNNNYFIVTDLVKSPNISAAYLNPAMPDKRLTLSEVKSIASQLLEFLSHSEKLGVIHHDIKPKNLVWEREAHLLTVLDLGSTKRVEDNCSSSFTYGYAEPEVLLGGRATASYDIWSAGCTLLSILQGTSLFPIDKNQIGFEATHSVLMNIVREIGKPARVFFENLRWRSIHFDENYEIRKTPKVKNGMVRDAHLAGIEGNSPEDGLDGFRTPLRKAPSEVSDLSSRRRHCWQARIKKILAAKGASDEEIEEWIKLLSSMLCYTNRASAKDLLKSPLFKDEIKVHLIFNPKCTIKLRGASKPSEDADLTINLKTNKNCCLHVPIDKNGQYAIILEYGNNNTKFLVNLRDGEALDITNFQAQLMPGTTEIAEQGEAVAKKLKLDPNFPDK